MSLPSDPRISAAVPDDLDAICAIADASFPSPWSREAFASEIGRPGVVLNVLRESPTTVPCAFIHYWLVYDEVQLHNIAVMPTERGKGYALALMRDLVAFAQRERAVFVSLEVRRGNARAIALYQGMGFAPVGVRARYYSDNQEDALMMLLEKP